MVKQNGKPNQDGAEVTDGNSLPGERAKRYPRLESFALPGPWTEADEKWFQYVTREFGGAPERDHDL
jgi:hypothetical protein